MQAEIKPIKILVIDDEPLLETMLTQTFDTQISNNEWQFFFASNGIEGLKILENDPDIGIILTDINMPQMDGLTFLDKLSQGEGLHRAVVVSAYGDMHNIRVAMNLGAADFVTKPIDLQDLENTLKKLIEQYNTLKQGIALEQQDIEIRRELEISARIQRSIIPTNFDLFDKSKVEIYGQMTPANEVGGDFLDVIKLDENRVMFVVGDVCGKGISAALFMAVSQTLMHAVSLNATSILECICTVDDILSINNTSTMFFTCFCAILDVNTGELQYCNAGHCPAFIISETGDLQRLDQPKETTALGLNNFRDEKDRHSIFKVFTIQLNPNDAVAFYSDGVTEAFNPNYELYEESRLIEVLKKNSSMSAQDLVQAIKDDLEKFEQGEPASDDKTILVVKFQPKNH